MDVEGTHRFTVHYDDDLVRDAIRTFIWRRGVLQQKTMWLAALAMACMSISLIWRGEGGWIAGVILAFSFLPVLFVAVMWRSHHTNTFGRYRRMGVPEAKMTLDADGLEIVSDLGSGRLTFAAMTEVWERPRSFMLFTGPASFNILPRQDMPQTVEAILLAMANRR